jgi:DNA-binding winged helix-turn-helix (wHTH) protein/tetratricopeptide (TPR) repeat protein
MNDTGLEVYRFGRFLLNPSKYALYLANSEVPLAPKSFEVLLFLARNSGRPVTKEEVFKAVWPDSFVEEANLAQHIFRLRKILESEPGTGNLIRTLPGRGYLFTAEVSREIAPTASAYETDAEFSRATVAAAAANGIAVERWRERTHVIVEEMAPKPVAAPARAAGRVGRRGAAAIAALLAVVALAGWAAWRFHVRSTPREYRQIVLADFTNTTGDTTFDQTLKRALEIDLDQSPYMDVLSERDEVNTLLLMGRPSDTPISADVATEICERTNREVLLTGAISTLGSRYLLTLTGSDCNSGKRLAVAKAEAKSREGILEALDSLAEQVRKQLNESAQSLKDHEIPLRVVTTSSLEALKAYSYGKYLQSQHKGLSERIAAYQRAIELDPQFAMAYRELGMENNNVNQFALASLYYKKAFDLSDHLSTLEQFIIRANYYGYGRRDLAQGIKEFQLMQSVYPQEAMAPINIMDEYTHLGQYAASIAIGEQAVKRFPTEPEIYSNLSEAYKATNRFDDSLRAARMAAQVNGGDAVLHLALFEIAFARQDPASLARESQWFDAAEDSENVWYYPSFRGSAAAALGKYRDAEKLFQKAIEAAQQANLPETADRIRIDQALAERVLGFPAQARATLRRVSTSNVDEAGVAAAWAELGDTGPAQRFLSAHKGPSPDTLLTYEFVPRIQATLALQHQKPLEAIAALEISLPYEMRNYMVPALRGEAYLQARQPELAVNEFRKILDNPGIDCTSVLYPLAYLGAARAYAMENKKVESRHEYEAFFNRWKDADADLPILKQAKQEFAQLNAR